jgi:NitT/TauT family transport system substrate-binding protein
VGLLGEIEELALVRAVERGYFTDQGVHVERVKQGSADAAAAAVRGGDVDIALASYDIVVGSPAATRENPGATTHATGNGATEDTTSRAPEASLAIVADAYTAGDGSLVVVAAPGSTVAHIEDLAHARIAIPEHDTIPQLALTSTLDTNGVDTTHIRWVRTSPAQVLDDLETGVVDAAVVPEPIKTQAQRIGAVQIVDCADSSGPTGDLPLKAWVATRDYADRHPHVIEAFHAALTRAIDDLTNRATLVPLLSRHLAISRTVSELVSLGTYHSSVSATNTARITNLMLEFDAPAPP